MASIGEKELKRKWPVVTGITATSKHEGRKMAETAKKSLTPKRKQKGLR